MRLGAWGIVLLAFGACKEKNSAPTEAASPNADVATALPAPSAPPAPSAAPAPPAPPTSMPTAAPFDAGEPIELRDDDRTLTVSYSGGMQIPCGKTKLVSPPHGTYVADLARGAVTVTIESACSGTTSRRGRLSAAARTRLKALVAAMGAPDGKGHTVDGPWFEVSIVRADGHLTRQGGGGFGDFAHDENAADIVEALAACLRR